MTDAVGAWLAGTRLSFFVNSSPWIWASLETLHFFGLAVLIGTAGLLDLRLLGFFRGLAIRPLRALFPWMIGAFLLNLVTGVLFFVGSPFQYIHNTAFALKLLLIGLAGGNALLFAATVSEASGAVGSGMETPPLAKVCGAVSLACWLGVLYFGRMIPYF
jgi:hypothetical protein